MKRFSVSLGSLLLLLLTVALAGLAGCASTDPENLSSRPWNAPNGSESGMPIGLMQEGR